MTSRLVVLDVVGLTPKLLRHMPNLAAIAARGFSAPLEPVLPAVTCSVQATFLTGAPPAEHGIVGNGWFFRDLGEVLLWRQSNALIGGEKLWEAARKRNPDYTVANVCWWYAMGADVDWTVTPRPVYYSDGRKEPDCYTFPPALHDELYAKLGTFPLFTYWGPTAGIASSKWIIDAARWIFRKKAPDLTLVYVPHLDYDLQRFGPDSIAAIQAAAEVDRALRPLLEEATADGATIVALSEYGITRVSKPVDINKVLRHAGYLNVHTQDGMEYLDPYTSRAFAVADHQIAHVYVRDPADLDRVRDLLSGLDGIDQLLDATGKKAAGLDHPRSGELVAVAEPEAWFTYYYWLDNERAPDFARTVEIHRKPGYDPAELFFDPADPLVKLKAATALARKKLGARYRMSVVPLDPAPVSGSHGRMPDDPQHGPMLICSDPSVAADSFTAADVKPLLLKLGL